MITELLCLYIYIYTIINTFNNKFEEKKNLKRVLYL